MTLPARTRETLAVLRRGDLAGVRELRLPGGLTEVPTEIFGLADTLEVLDLSDGSLTALPDDLGRLCKLRVLFCSGNRFERLPPVLGDCAALSQVGFRGTGLREIPGESLPPALRWLTLTDNAIEHLPAALGARPLLQKLMLSGNRLRRLPASLAGAARLELLRLAANHLDALPPWLGDLPSLAWLCWAGNPCEPAPAAPEPARVPWSDLVVGARLGEGASGHVHHAVWQGPDGQPRPVALKLFKGAMTSDGLPEREIAACLAGGDHPNLTGGLGVVVEHPEAARGLLMPLLPVGWGVLAGPPSLESCSRDVYDPALSFTIETLFRIARATASAAAHLHARRLQHGDLYAHNIIWDGVVGRAVLSDFGAASVLPAGPAGVALQRVEVRAWGLLLQELIARCPGKIPAIDGLQELGRNCVQPASYARPLMSDVLDALDALYPNEASR